MEEDGLKKERETYYQRRVEELERRISELETEREVIEDAAKNSARFAVWIARKLVIGRSLEEAARRWVRSVETATAPRDLASEESAELVAAIVRWYGRVKYKDLIWRVALSFGGAVSAGILIWHGYLLQEQNQGIQMQIQHQMEQANRLEGEREAVRRAELLAMLYDCRKVEVPLGGVDCIPIASPRARREALLAFIAMERNRGVRADLEAALLNDITVEGADLSNVNFIGANFRGARLVHVLLTNSDFESADLTGVRLSDVVARNASFWRAILEDADLFGVDLKGALLAGADFDRATFVNVDFEAAATIDATARGASFGLTDVPHSALQGFCGDEHTVPPGVFSKPPAHWVIQGSRAGCPDGEIRAELVNFAREKIHGADPSE